MQEIGGALGMTGGGKDRPLVAFQNLQPVIKVAGVILAKLRREFEPGANEYRAQFRDLS
jgi:hypothetical protein